MKVEIPSLRRKLILIAFFIGGLGLVCGILIGMAVAGPDRGWDSGFWAGCLSTAAVVLLIGLLASSAKLCASREWREQPGNYPLDSKGLSNFTPRAQQVLGLARNEADRLNHSFVGTEHLLLGLIRLDQGVAVTVLKKRGVSLDRLRQEVEKLVGSGIGQKVGGTIPYTPRVKKVTALAANEAKALNHIYVGTEHLLLGLMREGDNVAARLLRSLDLDLVSIRRDILHELDPNFHDDEPPNPPQDGKV